MKPTIGRIVHYQAARAQVLPAIVLEVHEGPQYTGIDLEVFGIAADAPGRFPTSVTQGEPGDVGFWFWPPRGEQ